jgi:TM2 domain-containing membrane protein YozV
MRNKWTTILLAFLLGGIWAHRFYLGNTWIWFLYLLFSWTFVPLIIWLIEVIYFAFMKQKEFDLNYNWDYIKNKKAVDEYYNNK